MRWPWQKPEPERSVNPITFNEWVELVTFAGQQYQIGGGLQTTLKGEQEDIGRDFQGLVRGAYKQNGVVFACILVRMLLFSEARFQFRRVRGGRPGDLFGNEALQPLERPWPGATTGKLLARMEQDVSAAGNFFGARRPGNRIKRMRPDWVTIVIGSDADPDQVAFDIDAEVLGYLYTPGGPASGNDPQPFDVSEVAHYAPIPDPEAQYRGMSWLNPVVEEILGDKAMSRHKTKFFEGGGTPNMMIQFPETVTTEEAFERWVEKAKSHHPSLEHSTLFLAGGADAKVIGATFEQTELKETQGALETRIAAAAGVPPVIVGLSEGLDAATYSNYSQARRRFADGTMRPLWREAAGALSNIIDVPADAELWYDDRDISFLQEDQRDAAEIQGVESRTIRTLLDAGFESDSVIEAVTNSDWTRLRHSGLFSVQLQKPGTEPPENGNGAPDDARALVRELKQLVEHT